MADVNENQKIKRIKLGNNTYDIYATSVDASAINAGEGNVIPESAFGTVPVNAITAINESAISSIPASAISGTDIPWNSISGLKVDYTDKTQMDGATTGIMTPAEIQKAIDAQIATVYKVKGTHTVAKSDIDNGQITNLPTAVNGDVYNIALPADVSNANIGDQVITNGDNIVYVEEGKTGHWDKLAGSVDTSTMATKEWVESYVSGGETGENVREKFDSLWNEVSSYIDTEVTSANATALWSNVTSAITSGINAQVWDKSIQDAETLSSVAADETARETSGEYLVGAGAIVDYVKDQIDSTIQETIDVVSAIPMSGSASGTDWGSTTALSSIPNVKAVTSFANDNFIAKQDIRYANEVLIIDNL